MRNLTPYSAANQVLKTDHQRVDLSITDLEGTMVSEDKHYEFLTKQIADRSQKIYESFNQFIRLFSAVVGGTIWISLQADASKRGGNSQIYETFSNFLVIAIAVMSALIIIENVRSWKGYRQALVKMGANDVASPVYIPAPLRYRSSIIEIGMICSMFLATILFCIFNPLALIPSTP
ncbi:MULTISPECIES: hypothetical protein [unclassified Bradyrhizobium]|uniref:hypothetical protein n=1 Tax=unclassified Bradyrhizobium TaxID=2631580 RepID=UPI001BACA7AA|nr:MULTISPECIES: hypothetical protein [unclassified Bradyrhizobium]MBR1227196.1 hypothetical protein [Bradyrhizobium sp. AUGA SZCCT0176]MBR1298638.1 hypothetical protein [Bradyrhizobium sp. AUGA SZCCT0042]